MCDGPATSEVLPSPKSQVRAVTVPSEVSVNATVSGATPVVGVAVNDATGGGNEVSLAASVNRFVLIVLTPMPPTLGPSTRKKLLPAGLPVTACEMVGSPR